MGFPAPTKESLFLLVLPMLAVESADSIHMLYKHFLFRITEKSLNAFYYICSHAKTSCCKFMNVTARLALQIVPENLHNEPVFLCINDTMVSKFGHRFENVSNLFDHAAHNGSNYLNGHCFVSLMLCVPVWEKNHIVYQSVPLGYHMWTKEVSKLELAAGMVCAIMPGLALKHQVLLLFDSWYAKKSLVCLAGEYENLDIICNARYDSARYGLPQAPTRKRGRPAKRGKRLFFSTIAPKSIHIACACQEKAPLNQTCSELMQYVPLFVYSFRWNIEVSYYEQKNVWSLSAYMIRSKKGIEILVNLINISYCAMKILPYRDETFFQYKDSSAQKFRLALSQQINQQVIFASFVKNVETTIKSNALVKAIKSALLSFGYYG